MIGWFAASKVEIMAKEVLNELLQFKQKSFTFKKFVWIAKVFLDTKSLENIFIYKIQKSPPKIKIGETYWHDHSLESSWGALSYGTISFSI
jgi:hypothetical protein